MKRLKDIETNEVQLQVYVCGCGFVLGLDATYIDQCGFLLDSVPCPNCGAAIAVSRDPAYLAREVADAFWSGAEKGPHGQNWKRLMIPTYDENGGEEKEYDWDRPAQLTLQEEEGLRVIMGDPHKDSSPDVIEKTPDRWRIFVHHDGGDPLCYIEFTDAQAMIFVDRPGGTETLLTEERVV